MSQVYVYAHSYNKDAPEKSSLENYCICCLEKNIAYINLDTCNHTGFFDCIPKFKIEFSDMLICYNCHYMLKKIDMFKRQTEESFEILSGQALGLIPTKSRLNNLKISPTHTTDNKNVIKAEPLYNYEVPIEIAANSIVKMEHETPLSEFKKEQQKDTIKGNHKGKIRMIVINKDNETPSSELKKEKQKERRNVEDYYEGKIRMIVFSEEEMLSERERCRKMESYLKFPFKCEDCIVGFDYEMMLNGHMESRHRKNKKVNLVCGICKSVLGSKFSYKYHMKAHYRRFECVECGKRAHDIFTIESHYNNVHGDIGTRYECEECDFVTNSNYAHRYHRRKHKPKVHCQLCRRSFVTTTALKIHMCVVHEQSKRVFTCTICHKSYKSPQGLVAHMAANHSGVTAYCGMCDKNYKSANHLVHHLKTHSNHVAAQRYSCDECDSKFRTKISLVDHVRFVHLKVDKHQCKKCAKICRNSRSLKRHNAYVHEKVRPPRNKICDQCGQSFTTLTILRSHIRTHTGERPLQCSQCPATFAHSGALYTHNKLLHNATTQR